MKESNFLLIGKPRMTSLSFNINKDYEFREELTLSINNDVEILQQEDKHEAVVILNLSIFKSEEASAVPFRLVIEIEGIFRWSEELEKAGNVLDSMLKQNAPAILYSYMRPIITLITVEANLPPLVIPLMNFNQ